MRERGRMFREAEGRKANDAHADGYKYFGVEEDGTGCVRFFFFQQETAYELEVGREFRRVVCRAAGREQGGSREGAGEIGRASWRERV